MKILQLMEESLVQELLDDEITALLKHINGLL